MSEWKVRSAEEAIERLEKVLNIHRENLLLGKSDKSIWDLEYAISYLKVERTRLEEMEKELKENTNVQIVEVWMKKVDELEATISRLDEHKAWLHAELKNREATIGKLEEREKLISGARDRYMKLHEEWIESDKKTHQQIENQAELIGELQASIGGLREALEKIAGRPGKRLIATPETDFAKLYARVAEKALNSPSSKATEKCKCPHAPDFHDTFCPSQAQDKEKS